jgi:hypothetical protein
VKAFVTTVGRSPVDSAARWVADVPAGLRREHQHSADRHRSSPGHYGGTNGGGIGNPAGSHDRQLGRRADLGDKLFEPSLR